MCITHHLTGPLFSFQLSAKKNRLGIWVYGDVLGDESI
jgi:hypothetical protein